MATNCSLTQDYLFGCDVGGGGVGEMWIIEFNNVISMVESSGVITSITKATGKIFRKYQLVNETSNANQKITGNPPNGTLFFGQTAQLVINKQQVSVRNEIMLLAMNTLMIIAKDNNDSYHLFGRQHGLRLLEGSADTGTSWQDRNGYVLNFTGNERQLAPFVDSSVISTLQTPGA